MKISETYAFEGMARKEFSWLKLKEILITYA